MPFALLIVGIVLLSAALRGQAGTLFSTLKSDFTGSGNYIYWVVAILVVGSVGYVKKLQPISDAFLGLVLIVLFLSNKGFFSQFMSALQSPSNCPSLGSGDPLATQATQSLASSPTVLYQPGQSLQQQLSNSYQNLNSALNSGAGYLGD
jgi:hypothetical protein